MKNPASASTAIMTAIGVTSHQQNAGIEQVNRAVAELQQVTHENAVLVEEARSTADSMREQAAGLVEVVGIFGIEPSETLAIAR